MVAKRPLWRVVDASDVRDCELFGTYEAAKLFHCSPATIRRWIRSGALDATRPGFCKGRIKITGRSIRLFIQKLEREKADGQQAGSD